MQWEKKKRPEINSERVVTRCAWWPVDDDKGHIRWLESYQVRQRYVPLQYRTEADTSFTTEWIDVEII